MAKPESKEYKYTMDNLSTMQAWPLSRKIQVTQTRLIEWRTKFKGQIYISFSGGKDSTVLADLAARVYAADPDKSNQLTLVFVNTGLEYPEIQKFVKEFAEWLRATYGISVNLVTRTPEMSFPEVLSKYGYPVIGKEVAKVIYYAKRGSGWALKRLDGLDKHRKPSKFKERYKKYKFMIDAPFDTSQFCCDVMKKGPAKAYEKETGRKPVVATMTEESEQRQDSWLRYGCNSFDSDRPISKPMSFWTEQDVLQYLKMTGIPLAPVYGEIVQADAQVSLFESEEPQKLKTTGCDRTGCMYCMFGIMSNKEPNRFQRMRQTHPRQYAYCIGGGHYENGLLKPDKTGLGLGLFWTISGNHTERSGTHEKENHVPGLDKPGGGDNHPRRDTSGIRRYVPPGKPERRTGSRLHLPAVMSSNGGGKGGAMMDKPKFLYLVKNSSGRTLHVWAASSNQAKRIFCKEYGIRPGDYWCGLSTLTARKLKPEEVKAWEADAEAEQDTLIFVRGMLEIGAKAYAERGCAS